MRRINFMLPLIIITGFFAGYYICQFLRNPPQNPDDALLDAKIDSLNFIVDSLEDQRYGIKTSISESNKVITNKKVSYEKAKAVIINQPVSADIEFFSKFLSKADSGFISSNNYQSIKKD